MPGWTWSNHVHRRSLVRRRRRCQVPVLPKYGWRLMNRPAARGRWKVVMRVRARESGALLVLFDENDTSMFECLTPPPLVVLRSSLFFVGGGSPLRWCWFPVSPFWVVLRGLLLLWGILFALPVALFLFLRVLFRSFLPWEWVLLGGAASPFPLSASPPLKKTFPNEMKWKYVKNDWKQMNHNENIEKWKETEFFKRKWITIKYNGKK